ncbi:MAG: glutamine-hydrolyzing carbamoyl-phosphate synthase small subunit [Oscillospiraceae bacterium]|nr:glutamine-hydrolyzing carbamoyl-phosphate synthase small subunit [Oscillospiraceae bacterium]
MAEMKNKKLVLENGTVFEGFGFGADRDAVAELVFNTSMVGYQEIVSENSYFEQLVVLTYPIIGSYGVNDEDDECKNPNIGGLIVRDYNDMPSNFRYTKTLSEAMEEDNIPGIHGLDTRALTRLIRESGPMKAMITSIDTPVEEALEAIAAWTPSKDAVAKVSCKKRWYARTPNHKYSVVAVDCGIKLSSIKNLNKLGCNVTVVPYNTTAEEVLSLQHDGLFIYDGPGNPEDVPSVVKLIRDLQGQMPILGVELGHQLVCLANGAKIVRMKAGHHGCNHPIRNLDTGKIEFAPQSHNYMLDPESVDGTTLRITHVNVLDGTPEACESTVYPTLSAQFDLNGEHPLYEKFLKLMEEGKRNA